MEKLYNKKHFLVFSIDNNNSVVIESSNLLHKITCCDQAAVTLIRNNRKYILDTGDFTDTREHMRILERTCKMALENKLLIDSKIKNQLGKLYAHYSFYIKAKEKAQALGVVLDIKDQWDGYKYLLWSGNYALWMYNSSTDNIILECTAAYHGRYYYNTRGRTRYIEYKTYLENYHTLFTYELSKKTAHDWLSLAEKYIKISQSNIARHLADKNKH